MEEPDIYDVLRRQLKAIHRTEKMIWAGGEGGGFNSCKETSICNQLNLIRVLPILTSFDSEIFKERGEGPQDGI